MPKYAEFVFSAYGLFIAAMGLYAAWLVRRTRAARRALAVLDRAGKPSA
jgi:heme exporter protein CcmD